MGALRIILTILFIIVCIALVVLVLMQEGIPGDKQVLVPALYLHESKPLRVADKGAGKRLLLFAASLDIFSSLRSGNPAFRNQLL